MSALFLYDADQDRSTRVTDGLAAVTQPAFDRNGKYLYVLPRPMPVPSLDWFAQSNAGLRVTRTIYAIALGNSTPNPFAKESEEEKTAPAGHFTPSPPPLTRRTPRRDDLEGISDRIVAFPIASAEIEDLVTGEAGQVWYLRRADGKGAIKRYDVMKRKDDVVIPRPTGSHSRATERNSSTARARGGTSWPSPPRNRVTVAQLANADIRIEPRAEWAQMLDEAWRINRDYFYATNYHGADWKSEKAKYAAFLPSLASRSDLERVIRWMLSELRVGHSYQGPGQRLENPARVGVGLLGADYEIANGKWRITRARWRQLNPTLRAPPPSLAANVRAGEYLLAVNGIRWMRRPASTHRLKTRSIAPSTHRDRTRTAPARAWCRWFPREANPRSGTAPGSRGTSGRWTRRRWTGGVRVRAEHRGRRLRVVPPLLLSPVPQGRDHRRRAV